MKLSLPPSSIKSSYDVIVVGSGYGGSVSAARLSEFGLSVCILEKGKEYSQGEFPSDINGVFQNLSINSTPLNMNKKTALFDYKMFDGLHVLTGSGLGGGSLINAGVIAKPNKEVYEGTHWPKLFLSDIDDRLEKGFVLAEKMLGGGQYPSGKPGFPPLKKNELLKDSAEKQGTIFKNLKLSIHFKEPGLNEHKVYQSTCTSCGNCNTGCNYDAKNSLDKNYLALAKNNGAEIFTKIYVSHFEKLANEKYLVFYQVLEDGKEKIEESLLQVSLCETLIIAAGGIGSPALLQRTQKLTNLMFSPKLGKSFSGNSGLISCGLNLSLPVNQVGFEKGIRPNRRTELERRFSNRSDKKDRRHTPFVNFGTRLFVRYGHKVGPTITAMIDKRNSDWKKSYVIEDATFPGIFSDFYFFYWLAGSIRNERLSSNQSELVNSIFNNLTKGIRNPILHNVSLLLGVGHDGSRGFLTLDNDKDVYNAEGYVHWPDYANQPNIVNMLDDMKNLIDLHDGDFIDYKDIGTRSPMSVHPIGGAVMGDTMEKGVVNHNLQVFDTTSKDNVHSGLYVIDASVLPTSLGINPLLTISAIAERAMLIFKENNLIKIQNNEHVITNARRLFNYQDSIKEKHTVGIRFEEKFVGYLFLNEKNEESAFLQGQNKGLVNAISMEMSVNIPNTISFVSEKAVGKLSGFIECPLIDTKGKMRILEGEFSQFTEERNQSNIKFFNYNIQFISSEGKIYLLKGKKELKLGNFLNSWEELTTLKFQIFQLTNNSEEFIGSGIAKVGASDFINYNLNTLRATNGMNFFDQNKSIFEFGNFFLSNVLKTYTPNIKLRKPNDLIVKNTTIPKHSDIGVKNASIESYTLITEDHLALNLRCAKRKNSTSNSILLIHGLTSSSDMFIMPEHNNITNYFLNLGYTVWLYDFRMSGRLPYNLTKHEYSFEHVALYDMPLVTNFIREKIGNISKLNVICHCLGSVSFMMSLFSGLQSKVDAVISNSVSLYCRVPFFAQLKLESLIQSGLLEDVLRLPVVEPDALEKKDWLQGIVSYGNSLFHHECDNAACHMLSFMWGSGSSALFNHKNMLEVTHDRLKDLFGGTSLNFYKHVLKMAKAGRPLKYFSSEERFHSIPNDLTQGFETNQIPILFVSGSENKVFTDSNHYAYKQLSGYSNELYHYHEFPGYGHQDVFMGKNVEEDVFPIFREFLEKTELKKIHKGLSF
ncbi:MAG: alpha/beta fold hydrolase [Leptospira sp.]|nr:alpha/beta fold hydrolase [Leptospira sp.]